MSKVVLNVLVKGVFFKGRELIDTTTGEDSIWFKVDSVIPRLIFGKSMGGRFREDQGIFAKGRRDIGHGRQGGILSSESSGVGCF